MKASEVLKKHGIPFVSYYASNDELSAHCSPTWDGARLHLNNGINPESPCPGWVYHEVSHHLFAPPSARSIPNYGLGTDPGGGANVDAIPEFFRGSSSQEDESAVCILDIYLMVKDSVSFKEIWDHANDYNILYYEDSDIALLESAGFERNELIKILDTFLINKNFDKEESTFSGARWTQVSLAKEIHADADLTD
jgi:hypothetical protein